MSLHGNDDEKNRLLESESEDDSMDESNEDEKLVTRRGSKSMKEIVFFLIESTFVLSMKDSNYVSRFISGSFAGTTDGLAAGIPKSVIIRNLLGFWILGLCNNYAYVIMLSAAHDILQEGGPTNETSSSDSSFLPERDCNSISTGAILLANILPSLAIKLIAPFILSYTFVQIGFAIAAAFLSFLLVSFSVANWMTFFGVACASLCSGLGEVTLLRYSTGFDKNVVSTWSSGTGASGVLGAFSYAAFTTAGLSPRKTLLVMIVFPFLMAITFCFLLVHPTKLRQMRETNNRTCVEAEDLQVKLTLKRKLSLIKPLIKYMIPLSLVYLAEYFINQGLLELVFIPQTFLTHAEQYRWYQVDYQIGVFISRSSVNLVQIDKLWLLPILQFANVIVFLFEAYYLFIPTVWVIFAFVLFEGLLGGASYVNTFYKITQEVAEPDREFSMGAASMSDSLGITIAGAISIPVHNLLCTLPIPK